MHAFPQPTHLPCPVCGASVARAESETHECDESRRIDYLVFQNRPELDRFGESLAVWLDSPAGRFAAWLAEHGRR
jgi:hypothetical protein